MSGVSNTYYPVAPLPDTNARLPAMTLRPASTALLTIDSEDRFVDFPASRSNPSSPYNFTIRKSESLMPGFMTRIGVSEVVFPWSIPNITDKTTVIYIDYTVSGSPIARAELELLVAFQRPSVIADSLQTQIRALDASLAGFTLTYGDEQLPQFQYATNSTTTVGFQPLTYESADYPYPSTTKQLFDVLGFTYDNSVQTVSGTSRLTFCNAIRYVDIVCNQLTNSQAQKDQTSQTISRDMLARVYVGSAPGVSSTTSVGDPLFCPPGCEPTTLYINYTTPKQIQWLPNQNIPGYLQFQVYDDTGVLLDESLEQAGVPGSALFLYGLDWSMTMQVTEC